MDLGRVDGDRLDPDVDVIVNVWNRTGDVTMALFCNCDAPSPILRRVPFCRRSDQNVSRAADRTRHLQGRGGGKREP